MGFLIQSLSSHLTLKKKDNKESITILGSMTALQERAHNTNILETLRHHLPQECKLPGSEVHQGTHVPGDDTPPPCRPAIATILVIHNLQQTWLIYMSATNNLGHSQLGALSS